MNILFIHPFDIRYPGGAETWISEVAIGLKEKGHGVCILYSKYGDVNLYCSRNVFKNLKKHGVEVDACRYVKLVRGFPILDPLTLYKKLAYYDIVYFMAYPPNEVTLTFLRNVIRTPIISGFHTMLNPDYSLLHKLYSPIYFKLYGNFDALHVLNKWTYYVFVKKYGIDSEKVFFIPNGVNMSLYYIENNPEDKFYVLFTGRLEKDKGADILCKIIAEFNNNYPELMKDVEFLIAGTGLYKDAVKKLGERYKNVRYLGLVNKEDLRKTYARSSVYLIPSRSEVMPFRVLEAMASGLPVVGSNIPGLRDLINDENLGKLIRVGEITEFCRAIIYYYSLWKYSPKDYFKTRGEIRLQVARNYGWEQIIVKLENMFRVVLRNKS
ncbi:MAG: glycosyltransferase family 4 protein [Saccharolobus sp.]|uniref:glycosyltransferase family 4 protein n=1 Tax=Saccharolobus sp. TaxID=2100761 RepID=UPI003178BC97